MADVTKDVSIRFLGDDQASAVADKVSASVTRVGQQSKLAADQAVQSAIAETKWADSSVKASVEQDKLAESTKRQGDAAKKTSTDVNDLTNVFKLLAASIVVKEFIDANVAVEKFTLGMTQIVGSADAAGKEFEYVRGVANRLGIDIADAASGFLTFSAATKGSALEGAGARTIFEAVAGTMASLGRSSIDTQGALVQLAQGVSKGKFELEDLKSIAERMPGFFLNFATAIGKTVPELFDLISAGKITGAEFLIFAEQMNKGIAGIEFNTFNSELARLKNALFDASVTIGQSGVFDALTKGIQIATAAVVGAVAAFQLLGTVYGTIIGAITTGNFSNLGDAIDQAFQKAGNATTAARDAMLGYGDAVDKVKPKVESTGQVIQDEMTGTVQVSEAATRGAEKLGAQLGALGIDPKKLKDPIDQLIKAFEDLAANPAASGDYILAGLTKVLGSASTYDDLNKIGAALTKSYVDGNISATEFGNSVLKLADQQKKVGDQMERTTGTSKAQEDQLKKNEAASEKARESAEKYALEMEKLASNQRIKLIEATVQLNIAQLENDTKRVIAAFDSINTSITSTENVLGDLFGLFNSLGSLDSSARNAIFAQIDKENELRQKAFDLQKLLTEAQIENLRAQTSQLNRGDALIKIDGAGLQPELEAFMFAVLRGIQVQVNRDGRAMLLGI